MPNQQQTVIPFNKKKLVKFFIASLVFAGIAVWMLLSNDDGSNGLLSNPIIRRTAAVMGILLFGGGAVIFMVKLTNKKPALIISNDGFTENASIFNWGFISWDEITAFKKIQVGRTSFIMVILVNPNYYVGRQAGIKRSLVNINNKHYGSPVSISANNLSVTVDELLLMLEKRLQQYRQAKQPVAPPAK